MNAWCWKCGKPGIGFCEACGGVCENSHAAWAKGRKQLTEAEQQARYRAMGEQQPPLNVRAR